MKIDTKVLAELVKPFNGIALNVFIDYCNYMETHNNEEPSYDELARYTGKDRTTIAFCIPYLKTEGFIKVKTEASIKEEMLFRSRLEDSLYKNVDMFIKDGSFETNETKERCREMIKAFIEEKKNNLPTRRELIDNILNDFFEKYFNQLEVKSEM